MADTKDTVSDLADLKDIAADAPAADAETAENVVVETMPLREQELDQYGRAYATGRRKDAVARVWLKPGKGKITVNGRDQETYFARPTLRLVLNQVPGAALQYHGARFTAAGKVLPYRQIEDRALFPSGDTVCRGDGRGQKGGVDHTVMQLERTESF